MKAKRFFLLIIITTMIFATNVSFAWAAYSYSYGNTGDFNYADDNAGYAYQAFLDLGLTSSQFLGSSFTKTTFLNNASSGNALYAYTHGNADVITDNASVNTISRTEANNSRSGDWKRLVFLDACRTADNANWAAAWGIANCDGDLHSYIGWVGLSYDNLTYSNFVYQFYFMVKQRNTINDSIWYAGWGTGITNYALFGNGNWSF